MLRIAGQALRAGFKHIPFEEFVDDAIMAGGKGARIAAKGSHFVGGLAAGATDPVNLGMTAMGFAPMLFMGNGQPQAGAEGYPSESMSPEYSVYNSASNYENDGALRRFQQLQAQNAASSPYSPY